jgi:hypothetical protein
LNPGRRGGKPATNSLSYGAASSLKKQMQALRNSSKEAFFRKNNDS